MKYNPGDIIKNNTTGRYMMITGVSQHIFESGYMNRYAVEYIGDDYKTEYSHKFLDGSMTVIQRVKI